MWCCIHCAFAVVCLFSLSCYRCLGECFVLIAAFLERLAEARTVRVMKTNLVQYLSSFYFVNQPLHVSGIFVAHHQEVYYIYTTVVGGLRWNLNPAKRQSTKKHNTYRLLYIYSIPPDDGLQTLNQD